ncbi:DNA repair protein RecO [Acetivibrio cellulolyticus]|uniref:DNA repair protein RecO n=1 Tax=Acetivibrio cellulolyticus TaxID=35830 RepID=UPI0001E2E2B5|nr:DNA repair protein RecO [Acetivibrio cellulolyticus]
MSYIKTKGVILKEINVGEADKIVTIFSKNKGKISGSAKGARRPKSSLVAGTQLFCYSEFVLFKGKDMYSLNSCDVIEPFYEIRNDLVKLTYAAHINEIITDIVQEEQPSARVLQLFLNSLYMLSKTEKAPEQIARVFEIRLLSILGYAPSVRGCIKCGSEDFTDFSFSFRKCGFLCKQCIEDDRYALSLSEGAARAIHYIVHSNIKSVFNFDVSNKVLRELEKVSKRYLKDRLDREYNKLEFLKTLNS